MTGDSSPPSFTLRDIEVFQPFASELPVDIVGRAAELADVRVAKLGGQVIGAYRLARGDGCRFVIKALAVYPRYRGRGVGRWLLGHAIGIAENRGGRIVEAPAGSNDAFFEGSAFERCGGSLRLRLTPE